MTETGASPATDAPLPSTRPNRRRDGLKQLIPMVALVGAEGAARALSFLFFVVAAHALLPASFGVVRYTITLSQIAGALLGVLSNAVMRDLGAGRGDAARTRETLGSAALATLGLWLVSIVLAGGATFAHLTGPATALDLAATLSGYTVFTIYYAIARGLGHVGRAAGSYVGANAVQILAFVALVAITHPSPTLALLVYGLSSAVPILLWELVTPVVRASRVRPSRAGLHRLWQTGYPLALGQILYLVWLSADQIWVEGTLGVRAIGAYGAARNLAQVLLILPAGVSGVMMPRVAQLRTAGRTRDAGRLIRASTLGVIASSAAVAAVIAVLSEPLLSVLYGPRYAVAAPALELLVVGMVFYAGQYCLVTAAVGWGRPEIFTLGFAASALTEVGLLLLVGGSTIQSAALWWASATAIGFAVVVLGLGLRPLWGREASSAARPAPDANDPGG